MRPVSGIFSKNDLQKLMDRRGSKKDLSTITINDEITDRYYQKEAILACSEHFEIGHRRTLLVASAFAKFIATVVFPDWGGPQIV